MGLNEESFLASVQLARLNQRLNRRLDQHLRPLGLRRGQHALLLAIQDRSPVSLTDLARVLEVDKAAVSRGVASCERQGWVRTEFAPQSVKTRAVCLTPGGARLADKIRAALQRVEADLRHEISASLYQALITEPVETGKM
ncbi:MarR family winged helix-turn-helix transcriptional regulator [Reinekea blandensis]|uniref:Regulatory protein, MarR n=1 Tax=Reinekea blandensis MED297 TaxID=314283 RepID=A4BB14_9GAMM|nr:MarR family transcriptional regulator [Reinekea blandensis]EAR10627.1 regulatory protein, MarR [Reinekea sp. MED297] [Reinekea blandensis MED297]